MTERSSILFYTHPARKWDEALPLGNGRLGATVWGDPVSDTLQLNEETLWDGRFDPGADNPECAAHLGEIREAIFRGDYKTGGELTQKYMVCGGRGSGYAHGIGINYGSFQTAGSVRVEFSCAGETREYRRSLDLTSGLASASWETGGTKFGSRVFCSFEKGGMAAEYKASAPFTVRIRFERDDGGKCPGAENCQYRPDGFDYTRSFADSQAFAVCGLIETEGGRAEADGDGITLRDVTAFRLYADVRTTYVKPGLDGTPKPSNDPAPALDKARRTVSDMRGTGCFDALLAESAPVLKRLLGRVKLDLGEPDPALEALPTDERLARVREGNEDPGLLLAYFDFGRYLLIASSYNCVLPANLQGIWSPDTDTIWSADYHININLQMNYWLAETCRMPELTKPLLDYVRFLSLHGRRTAKIQYGGMSGWVAHTVTNPWGFTAPGEGASWGSFMCAGAWCCQHIFERYRFSGDPDVLRENYDVLRGACLFFLDFLTEDPRSGYLVTCPSNSPENSFFAEDGGRYSVCAGPTMDNEILRMLFSSTAEAARILGIDGDFAAKLDAAAARLAPVRIGKYGQIMEWSEDFEEVEPGHRHISHLFALHPDSAITKDGTPELYEAAKVTLKRRLAGGGGHTGWSRAWVTTFFARLGDGNACADSLMKLLGRSTLPNLFDTHPPFQIDGNFGGANALAEMMVRSSNDGKIALLPALPDGPAWKNGSFRGFAARGGYSADCRWENGRVAEWKIRAVTPSKLGTTVEVEVNGRTEKTVVAEIAED